MPAPPGMQIRRTGFNTFDLTSDTPIPITGRQPTDGLHAHDPAFEGLSNMFQMIQNAAAPHANAGRRTMRWTSPHMNATVTIQSRTSGDSGGHRGEEGPQVLGDDIRTAERDLEEMEHIHRLDLVTDPQGNVLIGQSFLRAFLPTPRQDDGGGPRSPVSPAGILGLLLSEGPLRAAAGGDAAAAAEEHFQRILTQLMDQGAGGGRPAPPASAEAIAALPRVAADAEMLGETGSAECTICMDTVALGEVVTRLHCRHWFHTQCITPWLREHDTCPHCRMGVEAGRDQAAAAATAGSSPASSPAPVAAPGRVGPRRRRTMDSEDGEPSGPRISRPRDLRWLAHPNQRAARSESNSGTTSAGEGGGVRRRASEVQARTPGPRWSPFTAGAATQRRPASAGTGASASDASGATGATTDAATYNSSTNNNANAAPASSSASPSQSRSPPSSDSFPDADLQHYYHQEGAPAPGIGAPARSDGSAESARRHSRLMSALRSRSDSGLLAHSPAAGDGDAAHRGQRVPRGRRVGSPSSERERERQRERDRARERARDGAREGERERERDRGREAARRARQRRVEGGAGAG